MAVPAIPLDCAGLVLPPATPIPHRRRYGTAGAGGSSVRDGRVAGMLPDSEYVEWLMASQRGVLCRAQVLALGLTAQGLRYRIRPGGPWQRLLPGVYLTVTGEPTREQREVAALLYAGQPSV